MPVSNEYQKPAEASSMKRNFPQVFTIICVGIFLVPMWILLKVYFNPALDYFRGDWDVVVIVIPALILAVHFLHYRMGTPSRIGIIVGLVVPCLTLMLVSNAQYSRAAGLSDKLLSSRCSANPKSEALQSAWEAAHTLFMNCIQETSQQTGHSRQRLLDNFSIQDCEEYHDVLRGASTMVAGTSMSGYAAEWEYLQRLEDHQNCAGWCYPGRRLWSVPSPGGGAGASPASTASCSAMVAIVYDSSVRPQALQVFYFMVGVIAAAAALALPLIWALRRQ